MAREHETLVSLFDDIADAIRGKDGTTEDIVADTFPNRISAIDTDPSGDATATAADILSPKTAYAKGVKLTGTIPTKTGSDLTASGKTVTVPSGYYASNTSKSIDVGTVTVEDGTITASISPLASGGKYRITGSTEVGLTVDSAGYISSTEGTKNAGFINVSGSVDQQTITGEQTLPSGSEVSAVAGYGTYAKVSAGYSPTDRYIGSGVSAGSATTPATTITQSAPSISVDSAGLITSSVAQKTQNVTPTVVAGYVASGTAGTITLGSNSATSQLPTKGAATYNTSTSDQTISKGQYLTGAQTIKAVTTSGISASNIKSGATINVGDSADADRIAGVTGTFSASSTITGTGKSAAAAGNILTGKSAFLDGAQLDGTMANNGTVSKTLTTQGASYTIPAGYHSGSGKVTASLTASTLDNTMVSGESVEEATGDYGYKVTVDVPAGYHNAQSITKTFSSLFPAPDTPGTADKMLAGYKLYDGDGKLITGTMLNNGATGTTITTQGGTYSIPSGYTSGGTVTAQINNGVITSGAGTASATTTVAPGNVTIAKTTDGNASTGTVTTTKPTSGYYVAAKATAAANTTGATSSITGTVAAPSVGTAGYVSSTAGTKNTNTISGTATAKTSAKDSSVTYIPITSGAVSASDSSISGGSFTPTLTYDSTNANFKFGGSKSVTGTAYAKITTDGYLTSGSNTSKSLSATVSATGTVAKVATGATISGTTTKAPTLARTAKPSGDTWVDAASGAATTTKPTSGPYVQIDAAANTGTLTATPKVTGAGYGDTTNYGATAATATVGAAKATTAYVPITTTSASVSGKTVSYGTGWITGGSKSVADGSVSISDSALSVSPSVTPTATASATATNMTIGSVTSTKPSSGAYITVVGGNSATTGSATSGESSTITKTAGYIAAGTNTITSTATATANAASKTVYYPVSGATITNNTSGGTSSGTINAGAQIKFGKGWNNSDVYYQAAAARGTDKAAATYNTSTSDQTIAAGYYLTGAQTIKAVTTSGISAANIKAGTVVKVGDSNSAGRIANVTGTFTSDATAVAGDIASGKTAYVNGSKITGTGTMSTGDVTVSLYDSDENVMAYLNGKASYDSTNETLTSVGSVSSEILTLASAS